MDSPTSQRSQSGLCQVPSRRLVLEATALVAQTGFVLRGGAESDGPAALVADDRILGEARLPRDRLGRSGVPDDEAETLPLVIRAMPKGASGRMLLELGHGEDAESYHAALWLPQEVFARLNHDVGVGRAGHLTLTATTGLWIAESERNASADTGVTWLLGRGEDGAAQTARGLVERIDWSAAAPAAADAPDDTTVALAEDAEPPETTAEALTRINWSLKQIALVLIFLLIVVALK